MKAIQAWMERLRWQAAAHPCHVVLTEGLEERVLEGAALLQRQGMARLTLLGELPGLANRAAALGLQHVALRDPATDEDRFELAGAYFEKRRDRGITPERAQEALEYPLWFGALMVDQGMADGLLSGLTHSFAESLRAGGQVLGTAPGSRAAVALNLVLHPDPSLGEEGAMLFADTGAVADPDPAQLATIAMEAAQACRKLLQAEPRIALLSASHRGSLDHPSADKVRQAVALLRSQAPELKVDGEVHLDAALRRKSGDGSTAWAPAAAGANVLVFPNLDAADVAWRAAETFGGARVFGSLLAGLAHPLLHLPEGCTAQHLADHVVLAALMGAP
ncbi:MAG TPA: phosphate acyltransferase [Holophagaceae bacterium]|nr:phosphate acyltransferase [Holophagaceae bacterium]